MLFRSDHIDYVLAMRQDETAGDHEADLASQLRQVDRAYRDSLKEIDSLRARVPTSDYILLVDTGEVHHKDYGMVLFATHDAVHSVEGIAGSPEEPKEHLVKGLASAGSSAAVNPRDNVGESAEPSGRLAEKASVPPCGNPVMVNAERYRGCRLPSGHEGECSAQNGSALINKTGE